MTTQVTMDSEEPMVHLKPERHEEIRTPALHMLSNLCKTQHQDTAAEK